MNVRREMSRGALLCAAGLLLSSCQYSLALWVAPGSTADSLVLGLSESRGGEEKVRPSSVGVFPCSSVGSRDGVYYPGEEAAVWYASAPGEAYPDPTSLLKYGDAPGLVNRRGPLPLAAPGCYVVLAYARDAQGVTRSATLGFNVGADGKVREMSGGEYEEVFDR